MNYAIHNPHNKPVEELPVIYGFNNGGSPGFMHGTLIAQDGEVMGGHLCSHEAYMPGDLGIIAGSREDRHKGFAEHYPDGYRMDFVPSAAIDGHAGLQAAFALNKEKVANAPA